MIKSLHRSLIGHGVLVGRTTSYTSHIPQVALFVFSDGVPGARLRIATEHAHSRYEIKLIFRDRRLHGRQSFRDVIRTGPGPDPQSPLPNQSWFISPLVFCLTWKAIQETPCATGCHPANPVKTTYFIGAVCCFGPSCPSTGKVAEDCSGWKLGGLNHQE